VTNNWKRVVESGFSNFRQSGVDLRLQFYRKTRSGVENGVLFIVIRDGSGSGFGVDPESGYIFHTDPDMNFWKKRNRSQIRYEWCGV